jgi:hypothetical protein
MTLDEVVLTEIQSHQLFYYMSKSEVSDILGHPFPQANCLQILVESPSILSLQIFATDPTFLTFNQTHYESTRGSSRL